MSYLVLVRHGLSDYNKQGIWTGWDNPPLVAEGLQQARRTGSELKDIHFDYAYSSDQIRSVQTLEEIEKTIGQNIPITQHSAIRERNYGDYTRKNKWKIKDEVGEEEFKKIRRSWDYPPPNGESLKMVYERVISYFNTEVLQKLKTDKNIIIVSSGNALRALVKLLENIPDDKISMLEIGTGEAYVYQIGIEGNVESKEIRGKNPMAGKV